ncbi:helix-turn-helix domain-containing protein [Lacinutrix sp. MEBiC02404]
MINTIQIVTLLQGLLLLIVLFKNKESYLKPAFYLLIGCIIAVILYILGDDYNNIFLKNQDFFFFDKSLFITFLFLFIKYHVSKDSIFLKRDYLFFIPNIIYFFIESLEVFVFEENIIIELLELFVEITFLSYLAYTSFLILKSKDRKWMLYFIIPLILLISISIVNEIFSWFHFKEIIISTDANFGSYLLVVIAFLFYAITLKLILSPKDALPNKKAIKYKNSNLNPEQILKYKKDLIHKMEKDKAFTDAKLSIHKVADDLKIPRQYISEILNNHMHTSFQDFVNEYRVEAFIKLLKNDQYAHYTLLAIANEVGFNSKATFNATFKRIKGLTPSEYKKKFL